MDRPSHRDVEGLGQDWKRTQPLQLLLPALLDRQARRRTQGPGRPGLEALIRPVLQLLQAVEAPAPRIHPQAGEPHLGLDLALGLRSSRQTRVDVETHRLRVRAVCGMDRPPGARPRGQRRLHVVDPVHRRDACQALEGPIVASQPAEQILAPAPNRRRLAGMRQAHHEDREGLRTLADIHSAKLAPVRLTLGARYRLHPSIGPSPRFRIVAPDEPAHRLVRARVLVLRDQVLVQLHHIDRPWLTLAIQMPVGDHLRQRRRTLRLPSPTVLRSFRGPPQVVPHRALRHAHRAGDLTMILALLGQYSNRHDLLLTQASRHRADLRRLP